MAIRKKTMTYEMHECELHFAQVFAEVWDSCHADLVHSDLGELSESFFEKLYKDVNKQCSTFDNLDVQFDTLDAFLQMMPKSAPLAGIAYCVVVSYQIDEQPFGFTVYFGEAREINEGIFQAKHCDVACIMSAKEDEKDIHMLEHFAQFKYVA